MKSCEQMANNVFSRIESEKIANKIRKRKIALLSSAVCLAAVVSISVWQSGILCRQIAEDEIAPAPDRPSQTVPERTSPKPSTGNPKVESPNTQSHSTGQSDTQNGQTDETPNTENQNGPPQKPNDTTGNGQSTNSEANTPSKPESTPNSPASSSHTKKTITIKSFAIHAQTIYPTPKKNEVQFSSAVEGAMEYYVDTDTECYEFCCFAHIYPDEREVTHDKDILQAECDRLNSLGCKAVLEYSEPHDMYYLMVTITRQLYEKFPTNPNYGYFFDLFENRN